MSAAATLLTGTQIGGSYLLVRSRAMGIGMVTVTTSAPKSITTVAAPPPDIGYAIVASRLSDRSKELLRAVLQVARLLSARKLSDAASEDFGETEDGGASLDLSKGSREVSFVVPQAGDQLYFIAREGDGWRRAGVVESASGVSHLIAWIVDPDSQLKTSGLNVG